MKKSLKVIASAAMALSMFSSVALADDAATTTTSTTAAVKTSKDFKDLAGQDAALLAKIDALLKAGVFEGVSDDSFGISQNMTRAQVAKVLTLIYNVKVDTSVKTSSFTDVKADDSANGWAIPYIEAAKKAGLIDGMTDTTFAPGDNVTLGQFATLLVKGLGKKVDVTGTPWYKDAVDQAVSLKILPAGTDGSKLATRADLVGGAFNGQQAYNEQNKPAQVSVVSAKATGVKSVTVNFDRDVDTAKATLTLKRGTSTVATSVKFADDKKSATLTLTDTKLMADSYSVTLGGLDASAIKNATGTFTAQDEVVQKIEFVSASDTIAKGPKVVVKIKATNQYGEIASAAAGNYSTVGTTTVGQGNVVKLTKDADGYLLATVNTDNLTPGVGLATITIISNDSGHVTATKNFKVGTQPILSKLELGSAQYSNGTSINGTGDTAKFALNLYDQYGSMMGYDALNVGAGAPNEITPTVIWNDFVQNVTTSIEDDGNNIPTLKISLTNNVDKAGDYNFTVVAQAATATGKVSIKSSKIATKVQIGSLDDVIAAGDTDAYIPVIAYDAQGNQLSADDLVSTENLAQIKLSSNYPLANGGQLENSGEHKGTIHVVGSTSVANTPIATTKNSVVSVSAFIATANVSSNDSKNFTVQAARIPDHFKEITAPGKQIAVGGTTSFQYAVIDQYGKQLDKLIPVDDQGNYAATGGHTYTVSVTAKTYAPTYASTDTTHAVVTGYTPVTVASRTPTQVGTTTTPDVVFTDGDNLAAKMALVVDDNPASGSQVARFGTNPTTFSTDVKHGFNDTTYRFGAFNDASLTGSTDYKVELTLVITKDATNEMSKITRTVTVAKPSADLTYSINSVPALWNAKDSGVVTDAVYDTSGSISGGAVTGAAISKATQLQANSKFGREITLTAKNAAGEVVGLPRNMQSVTSSDTNVANVWYDSVNKRAYVIGNKAGTAKVSVTYQTPKGEIKSFTTDVTVKNDALTAANVSWDDRAYDYGTGANAFNAFNHLNVTDSYGKVYEDTDAQKYNYALGVTFSATNVKGGTVSIDQFGNVSVTGTNVSFDLTASTGSGKTATTTIYANSTTVYPRVH
ncbi:S-layer homology domain-containing protein [Gordoniibacillus kamchatkensis]|uniref:S-layer homology domain-containing protein n=1 Tax=Gordoniibacillus kamchatkensis TaxID=1590651 RepID=UPI00059772ED|nr:S-layer homology domain-containing protein [Paenibacillus sp. VKM B-2647]